MAIVDSQLAQITARAGVLRAGTGRAGCALHDPYLKVNSGSVAGQVVWNRPVERDGDPDTEGS